MRRIAWGAAAIGATVLLGLLAAGWRPVVLLSDSMGPAAPAGSLLVARPVPAGQIEVGDVVTVPIDRVGRVTHRVVALEELDGETWARLRGDANDLPDPGRVALPARTLRTVMVVPLLGRLLAGDGVLMLVGGGLLLVGAAGLVAVGPRPTRPRPVRPPEPLPPRVTALLATLEALADDGMDPATLAALGRVRIAPLFGAEPAESAVEAAELDDGARFVLVALADADPAALAIVPAGSRRAVAARAAVADWWARVAPELPPRVRVELTAVLTAVGPGSGIAGAGPVD